MTEPVDALTTTLQIQRAAAWRRAWPLAVAALALLWLAALGMRSLISSDEGRYASISLAMLQSGDWVTPRLNGLLYFEKPPLQYWAGALAMASTSSRPACGPASAGSPRWPWWR
jgi:4-amino-4-deoxy-L-arabinose transferase-like glycosyltransferase